MLPGISSYLLQQLQSVMNSAARFVFSLSSATSLRSYCNCTGWENTGEDSVFLFKLAVLVCKCLHGTAPLYLTAELENMADFEAQRRTRRRSGLPCCCCPYLEKSAATCHVRSPQSAPSVSFPRPRQGCPLQALLSMTFVVPAQWQLSFSDT